MSRFGWMYASSELTGAVANGPDKSVQFASGSLQKISGSSNFTFDYTTNTLYLTGTLRADTLIVSASQIFKSGSTIFGDDVADTHQFTGSIYNTTLVSGSTAQFTTITGSTVTGSTARFTTVTGSTALFTTITGSTAQFTTVTGSTVTGSTALFTTVTGSTITATTLTVNSNATVVGNILGSAALKAGYGTFSSNFVVASDSYFSGISTTGSAVTASFNAVSTYPSGQTMIFKDTGGTAGTNNILLKPSGSQTIDGATGLIISVNSGSVTIVSDGVSSFYIVGTT